jgi:hypothetical protein
MIHPVQQGRRLDITKDCIAEEMKEGEPNGQQRKEEALVRHVAPEGEALFTDLVDQPRPRFGFSWNSHAG